MPNPVEYGRDHVRTSNAAISLDDKNWIIAVNFDPTTAALATADQRTNRCGIGSIALNYVTGIPYRKKSTGTWAKIDTTPTGAGMELWGATAPDGWILAWGTIGSASSGASNRANADTQDLFNKLWADFSDTNLPLTTALGGAATRGASAAADWALNRRMSVPDKRGRVSAGKDNMGGTAASRLTNFVGTANGIDGTALGNTGGEEAHLNTGAEFINNHTHTMGNHTHNLFIGVGNDAANSFIINVPATTQPITGTVWRCAPAGGNGGARADCVTGNTTGRTNTPSTNTTDGVANNVDATQKHNNVQPTIICNYMIKL